MISFFDPLFDTNPCYETRMKGYCIYFVNLHFPFNIPCQNVPLLAWKLMEIV